MAALAARSEGGFGAASKKEFAYTSCFCEENAIRLQQQLSSGSSSRFFACFLSNGSGVLPLWKQQAGNAEKDGVIFWDYHVFVVECRSFGGTSGEDGVEIYVWDLDSTLPFPCTLEEYVRCAIKPWIWLQVAKSEVEHRVFRLCGKEALSRFSSDRRHMKLRKGEAAGCVLRFAAPFVSCCVRARAFCCRYPGSARYTNISATHRSNTNEQILAAKR